MMKGSIEAVANDTISGWIYVPGQELRDQLVLAFIDLECVGSGKVSVFRQDLADAGLGDGFLGFHFPIRVSSTSDLPRVIVRLDGSDAVFVQRDSCVGARQSPNEIEAIGHPGASLSAGSLQWMLARGWLTQADHDFLKFFGRMGIYDRSLRMPRVIGEATEPARQDPALAVRDQLALWAMREIETIKRQVRPQDDLVPIVDKCIQEPEVLPIYAIWSAERGKLGVAEGSHNLRADDIAGQRLPFIDYPFGPDRVVLLHAKTVIRAPVVVPQGGVVVLTARVVG